MDELVQQLLSILRGMWHRRWIGLTVAWLVAVIGVTLAFRVPDRYEASARVYVDTQTLLRPLMEGLSIQPNLDQQVSLISRTLMSRPNIEKLIRMADLDYGVVDNRSREDLIDSLMKGLQLTGNASNNLYVITYRDSDPERGKKIVQSLLSIFVESSLGDKRQDTRSAVKFVDDQVKQYEENLRAAEGRLKDFRLKYLGVTGQGAGTDYFAKIAKVGDDIESARLELRAAEEARDAYKRELAGETAMLLPETSSGTAATVTLPASDTRLNALKVELDGLLRKYTEDHPDVIAVRKNIKEVEEQRREELKALSKPAAGKGDPSIDRNPVFQQLKVSLAEAEANVASLRAKLNSYEAQYAQLRQAARMVPQVEAEFAQLNRDYDIQKRTYETLLARRQSAALGEGVQDAGGTQFRVIDPPRVSPQPLPPTRVALLGLALLVSLGAGLVASFAASEIMPIFHDARSLRIVTNRPILGLVTLLPSAALTGMRRRNAIFFSTGTGVLFIGFGAAFAFALLAGRIS